MLLEPLFQPILLYLLPIKYDISNICYGYIKAPSKPYRASLKLLLPIPALFGLSFPNLLINSPKFGNKREGLVCPNNLNLTQEIYPTNKES